uniref:Ig-like domain-containing protein n=1 Tax=uncultured Aliivibrio sp. TaxID=873085 RepID=UPI0026052112
MSKVQINSVNDISITGFDIIVKLPNGEVKTIKNGVTSLLKGELNISTTDGNILPRGDILNKVNLESNAAVLIPALIHSQQDESNEVKDAVKESIQQNQNELKKIQEQLKELAELKEKLEEKRKQEEEEFSDENNAEALLIEDLLNQANQAVIALSGLSNNEGEVLATDANDNTSKKSSNEQDSPISSGSSSGSSQPLPSNEGETEEKTDLFVDVKLSSRSDSGTKNDFITNINKPIFEGKTLPGATISISIDGVIYESVADTNGNAIITLTDELKDGEYNLIIKARDDAGNEVSVNQLLIIDTIGPEVSFTLDSDSGTSDSDGLTNINAPTFTGKISGDPKSVSISVGDISYVLPAENGEWSFTFPVKLIDGEYEFSISAIDEAGNETIVKQKVTIDTVNDFSVSITDITDSGEKDDWVTNIKQPIFRFEHEIGSTIQLILNDVSYDVVVSSLSPTIFQLPNDLPEGIHNITFISIDAAGNKLEIKQVLTIDLTPPNFSWNGLSEESNTGDSSDNITSETEPTFIGRGEIGANVFVEIDGVTYSAKVGDNGRWSVSVTNKLLDETYSISAYAIDIAGNRSEIINSQIIIDTIGPQITGGLDSISDSGQFNNDGITNAESIVFKGNTEPNLKVTLSIVALNITRVVNSDHDGNWQFNVDGLDEGTYTYSITAVDAAGNESVNSAQGTVVIDRTVENFSARVSENSDSGINNDSLTNIKTPTLTGTGEPGAKITVNIKNSDGIIGNVYGPVTVNQNGLWSYTIPDELNDGKYTINFSIVDIAGNIASIDLPIEIDTQITLTAELDALSDSGDNTDNITNVSQPEFKGISDAGATIHLNLTHSESGRKIELTSLALANGVWSISIPKALELTEQGEWAWIISATDIAGNKATPVSDSFIFDNISPDVQISLNSDTGFESTHTNDNTLNFLIITEPTTTVSLSIFKVANGIISTTPAYETAVPMVVGLNGRLTYDVSELIDGEYAYNVLAIDVAGNQTVTDSAFVTIDTLAPNLGIVTLTDSSDSNEVGDNITNKSELSFRGNGSEVGSIIHISVINKVTGIAVSLSPSIYNVSSTNWVYKLPVALDDGLYNITFKAEDSAGNYSPNTSLDITIDTIAPQIGDVLLESSSDTGIMDNDFITNEDSPTFIGSAEYGATITLSIYRGNTFIKSNTIKIENKDGTWSLNIANLPDGQYRWVVSAKDLAGNESRLDSQEQLITIDTIYQGATGKLDNDSNSGNKLDNITNEHNIKLTGQGEVGSSVNIKALTGPNGTAIDTSGVATTTVNSLGVWELLLPTFTLNDGNYSWTVELEDIAGNRTEVSGIIVLDTETTVDGILESDSGLSNVDGITNDNTPTFSGNGEPGGTVKVVIFNSNAQEILGIPTTIVGGDGTWRVTVPTSLQMEGEYTWHAEITDIAGNKKSTEDKIFILDESAPIILSAGIILDNDVGFESDPIRTNNDRPMFQGQTSEANGSVVVYLYAVNNGVVSGSPTYSSEPVTASSQGNFTINISDALNEGEYRWVIEVTDIAGNKGKSESETIIVDKTAPTLSNVALSDDSDTSLVAGSNHSNDETPTFVGTSEAGARVSIQLTNGSGERVALQPDFVVVQPDGSWSYTPTTVILDGSYSWIAQVMDAAGNTSNSAAIVLNIDTVAPELSGVRLDASSDTGDLNDDSITKDTTPTFSGTAEQGNKIELTLFNIATPNTAAYTFTMTVANAGGQWSIDTTELAQGSYRWVVVATDAAGNTSEQASTKAVVIDTSITDFNAGMDASTDSGSSNSDDITNVTQVKLSGTGEVGATVTLASLVNTANGASITVPVTSVTVNAEGSWSLSAPALSVDGTYEWTVNIVDIAGNTATQKGTFVFDNTISVTARLDDSSDSGVSDSDRITSENTPTLSGTGQDGDTITITLSGPGGYRHEMVTTVVNGVWRVTFDENNALTVDGKYTWEVEAIDAAGNTTSKESDFTLDTSAPTASTELMNDSGVAVDDGITKNDQLSIKVTTAGNAHEVRLVIWKQGETVADAVFNATHQLAGSAIHTFTSTQLEEGRYQYKVIVIDAAGNESESAITNVTIDTSAPILGEVIQEDTLNGTYVNDAEVSFTGTAEAGSRVYFTLTDRLGNLVEVSPAYVEAIGGSWTYALSAVAAEALADGTYNWSFIAQDVAGNSSVPTLGSFNLDTAQPELLFTGITAATDSGDNTSDMLTNADNPVFTGSVTENAKITVVLTSIPAGHTYSFETSAFVNGSWTLVATSVIAEGSYNVVVTAIDMAGNSSNVVTSETHLVIDRTVEGGDDIGLHADSDSGIVGDDLTNNSSIQLEGQVEPGSKVTLKSLSTPSASSIDVSAVGAVTVDESGRWVISLPDFGAEQGVYTYTIEYVDAAGNTKEVNGSYELDTLISISAVLEAGQVESNGVLYTKNDSPVFKGAGTQGDRIALTLSGPSGSEVLNAVVGSNGTWSIDVAALESDGIYNWSIVATDAAGNTDSTQRGAFTLDTTPPSVQSLELLTDSGSSASDGITQITTPDIKVVTAGAAHQVKLLVWEVGSTSASAVYNSGFVTVNGDGSYTFSVSTLENGHFEYQVIVVDIAGNEAESDVVAMTIDTELPILGAVQLQGIENDDYVNDNQLVFSGTGAEIGSRIYLTVTNAAGVVADLSPGFVTVRDNGTWTFSLPESLDLADGAYTWSVFAQDAAGNNSPAQSDTVIIDTQLPIVEFTGLTEATDSGENHTDMLTNSLRPVFSGSVTESSKIKVILQTGATKIEFETTTYSDGNWTLAASRDIPEGSYTVTVIATDKAGNISASVVSDKTLVIDRTVTGGDDYGLSTDTDSGAINSDDITNSTSVKLSGNVEAGTKVTLVSLDNPNSVAVVIPNNVSVTAGQDGSWTLDVPAFGNENGEYSYALRYEDIAGNIKNVTGNFTFDNEIDLTAQFDSQTGISGDGIVFTNTKEPVISGTGDRGDKIKVVISGPAGSQTLNTVVAENGSWSVTAAEIVQDGIYSWTVTATDVAGNDSKITKSFTLDTTAPTATTDLQNDTGFESDDNLTNDGVLSILASTQGNASEITLTVWRNGAPGTLIINETVNLNGAVSHEFTTSDLAEGNYQYKVTVTDIAGNSAESSVANVVIDKTAPTLSNVALSDDSDTSLVAGSNHSNDETPTFVGTSEAGARVSIQLTNGSGERVALQPDFVVVQPDGSWSYTPTTVILDGSYSWIAQVMDAAGNTSNSAAIVLNIDTVAPELSGVRLDASSDTGDLNDDSITKDTTPTFSGTAEQGNKIELTLFNIATPNTAAYTFTMTVANAGGQWSIDTTELAQGSYRWVVVATDAAGNTSEQASTKAVVIDTSITDFNAGMDASTDSGSSNSDDITNVTQVKLSGTGEVGATVTLASLVNTANGASITVPVTSVTVNAEGSWSLSAPALSVDGTYEWTVNIVDIAGNTATQKGTFVFDNTISVTADFGSQTGSSDDVVYSNNNAPSFNGTGTNGDKVQLVLTGPGNYSREFEAIVGANGQWGLTINPVLPLDGTYSWTVTATDTAGNKTPENNGQFTLDTKAPLLTSASLDSNSDSGFSSNDGITQDKTPTFSIVGEVGAKVIVKLWSGISATGEPHWTSSEVTIPESGILSITNADALNDGKFVWIAILTDIAGNVTNSEQQLLIVDTIAPTFDSFKLASDTGVDITDNITKDNTPLFTGIAESGSRISLDIKNTSGVSQSIMPSFIEVGGDGNWSYQLTNILVDGQYTIKSIVTDAAGNQTESANITITIDTVAPLLSDVMLADGNDSGLNHSDGITNITTPVFSGVSEVGATVTLVLKKGDEVLQTLNSVVTDSNGLWLISNVTELEDGAYNWVATATDIAGNISEEITGSITIDTSIDIFTVSLASEDDTGSVNDDAITNKSDVSLSGSAEANSKITLKSLTFNSEMIDITAATVATVINGLWEISLPRLVNGDGIYNYVVEIEDIAGNKRTLNGSITLDTSQPILSAVLDDASDSGDSSDGITNNVRPTFSGNVNEASSIELKLYQGDRLVASYGPITTSDHWSIDVTDNLDDGTYTWKVEATDVAGNISIITKDIIIDTMPPTLTASLDSATDSGESSSDGITKEQTLNFKGSVGGEGSSLITVRLEFGLRGEIQARSEQTVTSGNNYDFTVNASIDGTYTWKVIAVDVAGNEIERLGTVIVDTQLQDFSANTGLDSSSDVGESDIDGISSDTTPSFVGKTEPNAKVSLTVTLVGDVIALVEVHANDNGDFFITIPSGSALTVDGTYLWTLQAEDLAGNTKSKSGSYTLDTTAPDVSFVLDNDSGNASDDWITKNNQLSISGSTNDAAQIKVILISGSTILNEQNITPIAGAWDYSFATVLDDGRYTVKIESTDIAGNSFSANKVLIIDTTVINEFRLESDSGSLDNDQVTNVENLVFTGLTDRDATLNFTVKSLDGTTLYNYVPTVNADTGQWSFEQPDILAEGQYIIVVTATDIAGNKNISTDYNITIDRTPPILLGITLNSDDDTGVIGDWITETQKVSITGQTSIGSTVKVFIAGIETPINAGVGASGQFTVALPILEYGVHTLTIISTDIAGNSIEKEQRLTVSPDVLPFVPGLEANSDSGEKGDNVTNITTPTITGSGTPGYTVKATLGDVTYTALVNEAGVWSFQIPVILLDGSHSIGFVLVDNAGNEIAQNPYVFTVDTNVDTTFELDSDSDSGQKGDFITNAQNINLTGSTEIGVTVVIKDKLTNNIVADFVTTSSSWRYAFSGLAEGIHVFVVELRDKAGNESSQEVTITIDRTPPVLTAMVGDDTDIGSIVSKSKNQTFSGTVNEGTISLILAINGSNHDVTINDDGSWSLELTLNEGLNNFTITAEDVAGNSAIKQGIINIKTEIRFTMEVENDNGQFDTDKILSGSKIVLGGNGGAGDNVRLTLTNSQGVETNITLTVPSSGIWQHEFTDLSDGSYTVSAVVSDDAGNTLNRELNSIVVDNQNQSFSGLLVDDNGLTDDNIVSTSRPTFKGVGEIGSEVTIVIAGISYNTQVSSSGTWQFQLPVDLSDGPHSVLMYSIDRAGNKSPNVTVEFDIDSTAPEFTYAIDGVANNGNDQYLNASSESLIFRGTASEAGRLTIHINNMEFTQVLSSRGDWTIDVGTIVERAHPYTILFEDIAGNKITKTGTIIVDRTIKFFVDLDFNSDTHGPQQGQTGDNITSRKDLTFTFQRSAAGTDNDVTASVIITGPASFTQEFNDIDVSGTWRLPVTLVADGNYVFNWSFIDSAGNTASSRFSVTVDSHIDNMIIEDFSIDGMSLKTGESLSINKELVSLNFNPTTSSEYTEVRVQVNNGREFNAVWTGSGYVVFGMPLSDGINNITITAWDRAGNSTTINQKVVVKTEFDVLELSIDGTHQDNLNNISDIYSNSDASTITLSGNTDLGSSFVILVDGRKVHEGTVNERGEWVHELVLSEGSNKVVINFTDIAGNEKSLSFNGIIDTVNPIITIDSIVGEGYQVIDGDKTIRGDSVILQGRIDAGSLITSITLNGVSIVLADDYLSAGRWNIDILNLVEGNNAIIITTEDKAGNITSENLVIHRDSMVSDFTVVLSDNEPFVTDIPTLNGTVEQGSSMTVELLTSDKSVVYTSNISVNAEGDWGVSAPTLELIDGQYTWKITAQDLAGNELVREISFTLDTLAPNAPSIALDTDSGTVGNDLITNDGAFTVTPSEVGNRIEYLVDSNWVTTQPVAVEGINAIVVREVDAAGNASEETRFNFTLDTRAPNAPSIALDTDSGTVGN